MHLTSLFSTHLAEVFVSSDRAWPLLAARQRHLQQHLQWHLQQLREQRELKQLTCEPDQPWARDARLPAQCWVQSHSVRHRVHKSPLKEVELRTQTRTCPRHQACSANHEAIPYCCACHHSETRLP